MIKKYKINTIAACVIIFVVIAFLALAFGSVMFNNNRNISETPFLAGTTANIVSTDGAVESGYVPDWGALPIYNESQLYSFFNKTGDYANSDSAYLAMDITITVPKTLQTYILNANRVLDGNGKKITMNFLTADWPFINSSIVFDFKNNGVFKDHGGNTSAATNRIVTAGGLLAQNHGTIKNINIVTNTNGVKVAVEEGVTNPAVLSPVIGLNTGNIINVNTILNGSEFQFHKNSGEWNSDNSYKNTAILGGLAGMSVGNIEGARIENNISSFVCNAKSKAATGKTTNTHTIIGGAVGKLLSDKADTANTGNSVAVMKNIIMTGTARIEATTRVESTTLVVGSNNTLREIGAVVGSNSIRTPSNNLVNDANGYAAGKIDGVLMGFTGQQYTSWSIGNISGDSGSSAVSGNPVLSCGDAANIVYVMQYSGRATQCDHKNSADWHNKVSYSTIYTLDEIPYGSTFEVSIDKAANALNEKSFNVAINLNIPENNDDIIFDVINTAYEMNASNNDTATIQKTEHIAGWNYFNSDGNTPFYDMSSPINSKRANLKHSEARPSKGWDSVYNKIEVSFGKNTAVEFGENIADKQFSGTDVPIILKSASGNIINTNEKNSYISSNYKHPDAEMMSVKSFFMPGEYSDIKILSNESDKYGCVDTLNKYVAPITRHGGADDKVTIGFPKITISNIPDPNTAYLEYTLNYSLSAGQNLLKNVYYSTPNNIWSPADSITSHKFFKTTNPTGTIYRLAGYGTFDPTWTSIGSNPTDKAVQLKVTNISEEFKLIIDHEAPVGVYTDAQGNAVQKPSSSDWSDISQTVYFKVSDEHSGIGSVKVQADGVIVPINDMGNGMFNFVVSDNRKYTIIAQDLLGNTYSDALQLMIDVVEPSIAIDGYSDGDTIVSGKNIIADISVSNQTSGGTITLSIDGGTEEVIDVSSGKFVFDLNGTHVYTFKLTAGIKGADGNYKSDTFTLNATLTKTVITLTDDDIIVADGSPIVMKYNGTNKFLEDEYNVTKTRIAWNSSSANYETLKNLDFKFYFKNSIAGTSASANNYLIIEPVDPNGTLDFEGEIRYLKANITPALVTVTITNMQRAYAEMNPIFTYTLGGLIGNDTADSFARIPLKTTAVADSPAGVDYAIEIDMTLEELNNTIFAGTGYRVNSATVTNGILTVTKRNLDSDFKYISVPTGADYTGNEIGIEAVYKFDGQWLPLPVAYYKSDGTALAGKPIDVGSYYGILIAPNSNFEFSMQQRVDFSISNAEIVITFTAESGNAINYQYSGIPKPATYNLSNEDYVNAVLTYYDSEGRILSNVPTAVGSYRVRVEYTPELGANFKKTIREIDYIISKADFVKSDGSGVKFDNKTVAYNGNQQRLTVENLPEGTTVEIIFNGDMEGVEINNIEAYFGAVQQRTYNVTAKLNNINYNSLDIKAVLTITLATMNVTFDNVQVTYDGSTHWLELKGLPENSVVEFSIKEEYKDLLIIEDNRVGAVNAGVYSIQVNISASGYSTFIKSAILNINNAVMTGIGFDGLTVGYDNTPHRISVTGAPDDANVVITVNNITYNQNYFEATNAGIYSATAKISKENYKTVTMQASLTINAASIDRFIDAPNVQFDYAEGVDFYYEITLLSDVTVTVSCKELNITGSSDLRYKLPATGTYNFEITVSKQNYVTKTFSRRAIVNEAQFDLSLESVNGKYNGTDYIVNLIGNAPSGTIFEWDNPYDNVELLPNNAGFKSSQAGNYSVTLVVSKENYRTVTLVGRLFIASANMKDYIIGAKDTNYKWTPEGHNLTIEGIPDNAIVNMTCSSPQVTINGNSLTVTDIGSYVIELSIEAPNFNNYYKKFDVTISAATFDELKCDNLTTVFDNTEKSIILSGIPSGATVLFMHNGEEIAPNDNGEYIFSRTAAGSYLVEYEVKMQNYDTKKGTAVLTINRATFDNVKAPDYEALFNGTEHVYDVNKELNLPNGTIVEFVSTDGLVPVNGVIKTTNAGTYKIIIKLTLENYIPTELQFYIRIAALNFDNIIADDVNVDFNEKIHTTTISGIPDGANLKISTDSIGNDGVIIDGNVFGALHAGVYTFNITLSKDNYNTYTKTVTLTINKAKVPEFVFGEMEAQWAEGIDNYKVGVFDTAGIAIDESIYGIKWGKFGNVFTDAGNYDITATVYKLGVFESDYEPYKLENAKFIIKPAKVPVGAFISGFSGKYDGIEHTATVMNVPEGFSANFITSIKMTNAGFMEVKAVISKKNYESLTVSGFINIEKVEVEVKYFVNPSYAEGYQPRVVGRYTDVNGEEINFLVDTSELEYGKAGNYTIKVSSVGDDNYTVSKNTSSVDIVIGVIKQQTNIAAIAGGSAGGGVALLGGIAVAIVVIKKKVVKL